MHKVWQKKHLHNFFLQISICFLNFLFFRSYWPAIAYFLLSFKDSNYLLNLEIDR